ncbi:hypothetical protein Tsubulata_049215 [Turnera subulata]|uniref:Uncharacterized protein n=1 Tax=Turnera subulata TaxID=218843 RepID=A0A9Q0FUZ4_9ROSI|nr:hypothetical protein Tsubulata_049215 [Turnera subulata]
MPPLVASGKGWFEESKKNYQGITTPLPSCPPPRPSVATVFMSLRCWGIYKFNKSLVLGLLFSLILANGVLLSFRPLKCPMGEELIKKVKEVDWNPNPEKSRSGSCLVLVYGQLEHIDGLLYLSTRGRIAEFDEGTGKGIAAGLGAAAGNVVGDLLLVFGLQVAAAESVPLVAVGVDEGDGLFVGTAWRWEASGVSGWLRQSRESLDGR